MRPEKKITKLLSEPLGSLHQPLTLLCRFFPLTVPACRSLVESDDFPTFVSSLSRAFNEPELAFVLPLALDLFRFLLLVLAAVFGVPSLDLVLVLGKPSLDFRGVLTAESLDRTLPVSPFDLSELSCASFLTFAGVLSLDLPTALARLVLPLDFAASPLDFPVEVPPTLSKEKSTHQQSAVVTASESQIFKILAHSFEAISDFISMLSESELVFALFFGCLIKKTNQNKIDITKSQ